MIDHYSLDTKKGYMLKTFQAFKNYNYRLFWFGQLISLTGTWMQTTAQAWLVLQLTHSPLAVGLVTALQTLPILLFALFGGVFADRVPKRQFLIFTQSVAAVQALVLAILTGTGHVQLWQLYVLALLLGTINAFDNPTRQAFVVEVAGREDLPNAVALNSSLFNAARIVGPAIGGVTIATLGIAGAFYANAFSFIPAIAALWAMRPALFLQAPAQLRGNVFKQVGEGLFYVDTYPHCFCRGHCDGDPGHVWLQLFGDAAADCRIRVAYGCDWVWCAHGLYGCRFTAWGTAPCLSGTGNLSHIAGQLSRFCRLLIRCSPVASVSLNCGVACPAWDRQHCVYGHIKHPAPTQYA